MSHKIKWVDAGREPTCSPDPAYPKGKDIQMAAGVGPKCRIELPYPAKRCGVYRIECARCRLMVYVTTAGRPDDPKSIEINCAVDASGVELRG